MIKNSPSQKANKILRWLSAPTPEHLVHYYMSDLQLIEPLSEFIGNGILNGDTCAVIATKLHIQQLNSRLESQGILVNEACSRGKYLTLDAAETLDRFMVDGLPNRNLFRQTLGKLMGKLTCKGSPVRAYGEMVALLWKAGNKEAVINLEQLWNELAEDHAFSLYCAYPELHFVMDRAAHQEISDCHSLQFSALATN